MSGLRASMAPPTVEALFAAMTEAQFQRRVRAYLAWRGYTVWVFPIMKRTMAGVPDLTFFHPARPGRLWCWELKRERRAVISPAQAAAIAHLSTVEGIDARIVKPSEWPKLRDALEGGAMSDDTEDLTRHQPCCTPERCPNTILFCSDCDDPWPCLARRQEDALTDLRRQGAQERAEAERAIGRLQAEVERLQGVCAGGGR